MSCSGRAGARELAKNCLRKYEGSEEGKNNTGGDGDGGLAASDSLQIHPCI